MNQAENHSIVLARQPIFDRQYRVYAYELLFRSGAHQDSANMDAFSGDHATTQVINHTFLEFGIDRVIGQSLAFVNLTRNFILSDDPIPYAQDRIVLEILEDIEVDEELISAVRKLVDQGYSIALDDFIFHKKLIPLVKLASIIKIDLLTLTEAELIEHVHILKKYDVQLLAEKVETKAEYDRCRALGFEYFQGYFFCKPEILEDKPIPNNQLKLLQIIQKLQDPDVALEEIEKLIAQDANLTYKLLRLLNSATVGMPRQVSSISQGLVILGLKAINTWISMIVMSEMQPTIPELVSNTLIRAKMAELMASDYDLPADSGFLLGLFSTMDVMLSKPMDQLVTPLPINDDMKQALINRSGLGGELLQNVIYYEQGQWENLNPDHLSFERMSECYINATAWMLEARQAL